MNYKSTFKIQEKENCNLKSDCRNELIVLEAKYEHLMNKYRDQQDEMRHLKKHTELVEKKLKHFETQLAENKTCCDVCSEQSNWIKIHRCLGYSNIQCEYCSETFKSTFELTSHLRDANHSEIKSYKCGKCSINFSAELLLKFHRISEKTSCRNGTKIFECYLCKKHFGNRNQLSIHLKEYVTARDQTCIVCDEQLTITELKTHLCSSEKGFACEYCLRTFNVTVELLQHLESHQEKVLHRCRTCTQYFEMEYLRNIHEKQHENEIRPYICEICKKGFKANYHLKIHLMTHLDQSMIISLHFIYRTQLSRATNNVLFLSIV